MKKILLASFAVVGLGATVAFAAISGLQEETAKSASSKTAVQEKEEDGKVVKLEDVPEAARKAIKKAAGDNAITEVKSETEGSATLYEAVWKVGEVEHEVVVVSDGSVCETEQVVQMANTPKSVQAMAAKHFPKNAKIVVEKKTITVYSLEAMIDGKEKEILLTAAGQAIEIEAADDDDDEDDEDEDNDDEDDDDGDDDDGDDDDGDDKI